MKKIIKSKNRLTFNATLIRFKKLLSREQLSSNKKPSRIIFKLVLLLPMLLSTPSIAVAEEGRGVELVNDLVGEFGEATDAMKSEVTQRFEESGIEAAAIEAQTVLKDLAEGAVPVIDDLKDPYQAKAEEAITQALTKVQLATNILNKISKEGAQKAVDFITNSPLFAGADFGMTLPTGRIRIYRKGLEVSLCQTTVGPLGSVIISGISNAENLCHYNDPRMANPTKSLLAFTYMAAGYTHIRTNLILVPNLAEDLTLLPAPIVAETYFKSIGGQWVQIRLAGADPKSIEVEAKFEVGIKGGVSYAVEAEVEGEAALKVSLKPIYAAEVIRSTGEAMFNKATELGLSMDIASVPSNTAAILKAGLQHLGEVEGKYEGGFGETSIDVKLTGGIGVGIWDTGIKGGSANGTLNMTYPLDALISMQASLLERYLDIALGMNDANLKLATSILEGNTGGGLDTFTTDARNASSAFVNGVLDDLLLGSTHITLASSFSLSLLGEADKESITVYESGLFLPVGDISANLQANPNALGDAFAAAAYLMLASIDPDADITPQTWADLEQVVVPGITYTLKFLDPYTFTLIGFENVGLLETIQTIATIREVLISVIQSGFEGSLTQLRTAIENALSTADETVINLIKNAIIPRLTQLGANGALGAEVVGQLGASIGIEGKVKASLFMLLLDLPAYQEEDEAELASASIPINLSLDAGASVGEGVEMTVDAGGAMSFNLFELKAKHWDGDLPTPALMKVAGFSVLEFNGVTKPDNSFTGTGFLMLPMGGIVSAEFSVDINGNVISGSWNGGMDLGPLGKFSAINGALDNDGIHGSVDAIIFGSRLKADFILASSGLLFGSYEGSLNIIGQQLAAVSVFLGTDGEFSGQYTGNLDIGGFNADTDLAINNDSFAGSGTLNILGSNLTASDIFISRSGQVSGTFTGEIQAGPHTLSAVSLRVVNGGLVGTAMMDLPGVANVEVDLQIIDGKVTATYVGDFMDGLSSQASMVITKTGISLSASLNSSLLTTASSQAIEFLLSIAHAAEPLLPAAQTALNTAQDAFDVAEIGLNSVQSQIDSLQASYKDGLDVASALITTSQTAVNTAQASVDFWNKKIKDLDDWYNGLGSLAKKAAWLAYKADRAVLVTSRNTARGVLNTANTALNDAKTALSILEDELDEKVQALKAGLQTAYDTAKNELTKAVDYLNKLIKEISVLNFDADSVFSVQAMSFTADLNALSSGNPFGVSARLTFLGGQGQINFTFYPADPADSLQQIATVLLAGTAQLLNSDITPPTVVDKTAFAQQAVADAERVAQDAWNALSNVDTQIADLIASYDSVIYPLELKVNDLIYKLNEYQDEIDALDPSNLIDKALILTLQSAINITQGLLNGATTLLSNYQNELAGKIATLEQALQLTYDEASNKLAEAQSYLNSINASSSDWQSGGVLIQLLASDNVEVASITYSASGVQAIVATTVAGNAASVLIEVEGMSLISFYATDTSGNVSGTTTMSASIDNSGPQINLQIPGDITIKPYEVEITAKDLQGSGIAYLLVSAFGAETVNEYMVSADSAVVSLTVPGITMLSVTAVDEAGNSTTITHEVSVPDTISIPDTIPTPDTIADVGASGSGGGSLGPLLMLLLAIVLIFRTYGLRYRCTRALITT